MHNLPQLPPAFEQLLNQEKIERKDLACLSAEEKEEFAGLLNEKVAALKGKERDDFLEKVVDFLDADLIWEQNHQKISSAIEAHVAQHGRIPTKAQLARACGLSRPTIHQHLKSFATNPAWADQTDATQLMTQRVMGELLKIALKGDLKAMKLYLDYTHRFQSAGGIVNNQNNFMQINKTVINQQLLQQLTPEQLEQIEKIIASKKEP